VQQKVLFSRALHEPVAALALNTIPNLDPASRKQNGTTNTVVAPKRTGSLQRSKWLDFSIIMLGSLLQIIKRAPVRFGCIKLKNGAALAETLIVKLKSNWQGQQEREMFQLKAMEKTGGGMILATVWPATRYGLRQPCSVLRCV
jgi:hypothetical protein